MWNEKKKSASGAGTIDEILDNSLSKLVASRPSMESSPRSNNNNNNNNNTDDNNDEGGGGSYRKSGGSSSAIPPLKPAAASLPLYPILPDSDDESEEFDFKKIAAPAMAPYPNKIDLDDDDDGDRKMAAIVPSAPSYNNGGSSGHLNGSFSGNHNNNSYNNRSKGDYDHKMAPMAPGFEDDYEDNNNRKMAATNPATASLKKPPPPPPSAAPYESAVAPPRKMTPEEKIQEKIRQENAMRASARENSGSFLTRPDRMEDKMLMEKKKAAYYGGGGTESSKPGAQSVAPAPQINSGPRAEVHAVQTAQPQEQVDQARKEQQKEGNQNLQVYGVWGIAIVVVIVVIIIILVILLSGGDDNGGGSSAAEATGPPPLTPNQEYVLGLLPQSTRQTITTVTTGPQARAFGWLAGGTDDLTGGKYSNETIYQRFALATIYYALNGANWGKNDLWLSSSTHECNWFSSMDTTGLPCDVEVDPTSTDYVALKHLVLTDNGLSGILPPEISFLASVETLDLVENNLQGSIPSEIGALQQVNKMDLSANALTGRIPATMGQMSSMKQLFLEQNELQGNIPVALSEPPLQYLRLISNNMAGRVPSAVCSIRSLSFDCTPATLCGCGCRPGC